MLLPLLCCAEASRHNTRKCHTDQCERLYSVIGRYDIFSGCGEPLVAVLAAAAQIFHCLIAIRVGQIILTSIKRNLFVLYSLLFTNTTW